MSRGRPKKSIETKRIQAVLPEEILFLLDKKVKGDKNLDRSKALTEAVNQWLGLTKKKRSFENIYKKFFGYRGATDEELGSNLRLNYNSPEDKMIKSISEILLENRKLLPGEVKQINDFLLNMRFSVDSDLKLTCNIDKLLEVFGKLFLNKVFPINKYIGRCQFCGKEFFKKKVSQKYDTPICKIHYLEKMKSETKDPDEYKKLSKQINVFQQNNKKTDINDYYNINHVDTFEKIKSFIGNLCLSSKYNYTVFKKKFIKYLNDEYELRGFGNITKIYFTHILKTYSYNDIEKIEYENFGEFFAGELFPDVKGIRLDASKDIKDLVSQDCFEKRKVFLLLTHKILELSKIIFIEPEWEDFVNLDISKFISDLFYKQKISDELKKDLVDLGNLLKAFGCAEYFEDKTIEICKNLIEENENNIEAIALIIDTLSSERRFKEVVYYYNKLKEIEKRSNKVLATDYFPFANNLPFIPYFGFLNPRHLEAITALAASCEGDYEMSINLLNVEIINKLRSLKERGEKVMDCDLYYPVTDTNFILIARALNKLSLSNDEKQVNKANELKEAYLKLDTDKLFEVLGVVLKENPELKDNLFTK